MNKRDWLSNRGYPAYDLERLHPEIPGAYLLKFISPKHAAYNGWYFYDECGADAYGPYETAEAAAAGGKEYGDSL